MLKGVGQAFKELNLSDKYFMSLLLTMDEAPLKMLLTSCKARAVVRRSETSMCTSWRTAPAPQCQRICSGDVLARSCPCSCRGLMHSAGERAPVKV